MKGAIVVFLFCLLPATGTAGFGLPWFHTRPKPVLFDEPGAASNRPPSHRPAVRPVVKRRDVSYQHDARESNEPARSATPPQNHGAQSHPAQTAR
jgi:hypothetical protein